MHIEHIEIKNYRCLKDVSVDLKKLNVMIGANGAGKTSLLEVFDIISKGARQELSKAISDRGGISEILSVNGASAESLKICFKASVEGYEDPITYEIEIGARGVGYVIQSEVLSPFQSPNHSKPFMWINNSPGHPSYFDAQQKGLVAPTWEYNENEPMLGQVPKTHENLERFRRLLGDTRFFTYLDVGKDSVIRRQQSLEPAITLPGPNGENLISALYNLRTQDEPTYERIMEAVRSAFPDFHSLDFPLVAAGMATMIWKESNRKFYPNQMSEGTLRFLWLATLLLSPKLPPITLIDEPEVSLHPEVLMILAGLLQEASRRSMIFVATHSDRLIKWLEVEEILVLDKENGVSTLQRADESDGNEFESSKCLGCRSSY